MLTERLYILKKAFLFVFLGFFVASLLYGIYFVITYISEGNVKVSNVLVSNLTHNSLSVSWISDDPKVSEIIITDNHQFFELVPRLTPAVRSYFADVSGVEQGDSVKLIQSIPRTHHHVTVSGLEPDTTYYLGILGQFRILDVMEVKTRSIPVSISDPKPIYSRAINHYERDRFASSGFVRLTVHRAGLVSQTLSSALNSVNGGWEIDLTKAVLEDGTFFSWPEDEETKLNVEIFTSEGIGIGKLSLSGQNVLNNVYYNVRYDQNLG